MIRVVPTKTLYEHNTHKTSPVIMPSTRICCLFLSCCSLSTQMLQYSSAIVDHLKLRQVSYTTPVSTAASYVNAVGEMYASKVNKMKPLEDLLA